MMFDLNKEREAFEAWLIKKFDLPPKSFSLDFNDGVYDSIPTQARWEAWKERAKAQAVPENTEDWYLNEDEGLWLDHDGIDGTLCELGIGEVKPVKHKEYLITQSNTLYAARVWDSDDDHIAWKLFESEESALEAATYCKQMYEASESGAEQ
ncbi:hypothetical protein [Acinetobacter baumannii]|uniref:hypothetical protein n=1 Tax=Acinetobacter baumannii TaxID=470 RepID=UPI0038913DAE